ncbi:MAG: hypothetical protein UU47_C0001G0109 [candidate division TM6 bacterium GW2011_GWE2_41_16]|nr:MAG: hypothetical protein UU47_C0001G0109 [candidate division TM6 bacterium GW2011_GWE2_41_16]
MKTQCYCLLSLLLLMSCTVSAIQEVISAANPATEVEIKNESNQKWDVVFRPWQTCPLKNFDNVEPMKKGPDDKPLPMRFIIDREEFQGRRYSCGLHIVDYQPASANGMDWKSIILDEPDIENGKYTLTFEKSGDVVVKNRVSGKEWHHKKLPSVN